MSTHNICLREEIYGYLLLSGAKHAVFLWSGPIISFFTVDICVPVRSHYFVKFEKVAVLTGTWTYLPIILPVYDQKNEYYYLLWEYTWSVFFLFFFYFLCTLFYLTMMAWNGLCSSLNAILHHNKYVQTVLNGGILSLPLIQEGQLSVSGQRMQYWLTA